MNVENQTTDLESGRREARRCRFCVLLAPGMPVSDPGLYLFKLVKGCGATRTSRSSTLETGYGLKR